MTQNRIWLIGGSIAIVVVLILGYLLGVAPHLATIALSDSSKAQVEDEKQAAQADLDHLKGLYNSFDKFQAQLDKLQLIIPGEVEGSTFADQLNAYASAAQVTVTAITLGEAQPFTPPAAAAPQPAPAATPAPTGTPTPAPGATSAPTVATAPPAAVVAPGTLYTVKVQINIDGSPDQVAKFAQLAQTGPRFFLDTSLIFVTTQTGAAKDTGTLSGYIYVVTGLPGATSTATPTPIPTPTGTPMPLPTPTGTATPKP